MFPRALFISLSLCVEQLESIFSDVPSRYRSFFSFRDGFGYSVKNVYTTLKKVLLTVASVFLTVCIRPCGASAIEQFKAANDVAFRNITLKCVTLHSNLTGFDTTLFVVTTYTVSVDIIHAHMVLYRGHQIPHFDSQGLVGTPKVMP